MEDGIFVEIDTWGILLYGVPFVIVVGWFSGRILGVRRGWLRALFAGVHRVAGRADHHRHRRWTRTSRRWSNSTTC